MIVSVPHRTPVVSVDCVDWAFWNLIGRHPIIINLGSPFETFGPTNITFSVVYGPLLLRANYFSYAGNFCSSFIPTILRRNTNEHTQTFLFLLLVVLKITKNIVINIPPPETARRALTCVARACVASGIFSEKLMTSLVTRRIFLHWQFWTSQERLKKLMRLSFWW